MFRHIVARLFGSAPLLVSALLCSLVITLLGFAGSVYVAVLLGHYMTDAHPDTFFAMGAFLLLAIAGEAALRFMRNRIIGAMNARADEAGDGYRDLVAAAGGRERHEVAGLIDQARQGWAVGTIAAFLDTPFLLLSAPAVFFISPAAGVGMTILAGGVLIVEGVMAVRGGLLAGRLAKATTERNTAVETARIASIKAANLKFAEDMQAIEATANARQTEAGFNAPAWVAERTAIARAEAETIANGIDDASRDILHSIETALDSSRRDNEQHVANSRARHGVYQSLMLIACLGVGAWYASGAGDAFGLMGGNLIATRFLMALLGTFGAATAWARLSPVVRSLDARAEAYRARRQAKALAGDMPVATPAIPSSGGKLAAATGAVLSLTVLAFIAWSATFSVDETVRASGSVITLSRTQAVGNEQGGTVARVLVRPGDTVAKGAPLVELENDGAESIRKQEQANVDVLRGAIARLSAETTGTIPDFSGLPDTVATDQRAQFNATIAERKAQIAEKTASAAEQQSVLSSATAMREQAEAKASREEKLLSYHLGLAARAEDARIQAREYEGRANAARASIASLNSGIAALNDKFARETTTDLIDAKTKLAEAEQRLERATHLSAHSTITAPVAGRIESLGVTGAGAVVKPGDAVAEIVPTGVPLRVEVMVPPEDAGHIAVGQAVRLFHPSMHYNAIDGRVVSISPDAGFEKTNSKTAPMFSVEIEASADAFKGRNDSIRLMPGTPVSAFIAYGSRRLIDVFIDPLVERTRTAVLEK